MRTIVVAVVSILMLATAAHAGDIFRYVTGEGTVSFTDSMKKIPMLYKPSAEEIVFGGAFQNFDRLTIVTVVPEIRASVVLETVVEVPLCGGTVSVTSERRQFGDFSRRVFLVHDECGKLVSETLFQPVLRISR